MSQSLRFWKLNSRIIQVKLTFSKLATHQSNRHPPPHLRLFRWNLLEVIKIVSELFCVENCVKSVLGFLDYVDPFRDQLRLLVLRLLTTIWRFCFTSKLEKIMCCIWHTRELESKRKLCREKKKTRRKKSKHPGKKKNSRKRVFSGFVFNSCFFNSCCFLNSILLNSSRFLVSKSLWWVFCSCKVCFSARILGTHNFYPQQRLSTFESLKNRNSFFRRCFHPASMYFHNTANDLP